MQRLRAAFSRLRSSSSIFGSSKQPRKANQGELPRGTPRTGVESESAVTQQAAQFSGKNDDGSTRKLQNFSPLLFGLAASGCIGTLGLASSDSGGGPAPPSSSSGEEAAGEISNNQETSEVSEKKKKRIVVLGTGWGGMSFLKNLDTSIYDVVVISPRNYFLFTPLLPGVTSGSVEARSVAEPIRRIIVRNHKAAQFLEAECIDMDPFKKTVRCRDVTPIEKVGQKEFSVDYDYLVIAVGANVNTFNTPGVSEYCHFLKEIEDAEKIREHVVDLFEAAALPGLSEEEKKRLLHFVVVGGGPTGVEYAAELHDLVKDDLSKLYPGLADLAHITLIQSGDHILNMFDQRISDFATKKFQRDGIYVKTGARVIDVGEHDIGFRDKWTGQKQRCDYGMIVWSTGIGTRPVITSLMCKVGQGDRRALATDEWLRVKGCYDVWAMGDCATIEQRKMNDDISLLFEMADTDKDGMLTVKELTDVLQKVKERYPQMSIFLKRQTFRDLLRDAHPEAAPEARGLAKKTQKISIREFERALGKVDSQMKSLPATAQVAAQQGDYLAKCFNKLQDDDAPSEGPLRVRGTGRHRFKPFKYEMGEIATAFFYLRLAAANW